MIGQPSRCAKRTLGITYEAYNLRWSRLLTRVKVGPGATGVRQQKGGVPIAPPLALRPITFICIWSFCWLWVKAANPHPHGVQYPCPSPVRLSAEHRLIGGSRSLGGQPPLSHARCHAHSATSARERAFYAHPAIACFWPFTFANVTDSHHKEVAGWTFFLWR